MLGQFEEIMQLLPEDKHVLGLITKTSDALSIGLTQLNHHRRLATVHLTSSSSYHPKLTEHLSGKSYTREEDAIGHSLHLRSVKENPIYFMAKGNITNEFTGCFQMMFIVSCRGWIKLRR